MQTAGKQVECEIYEKGREASRSSAAACLIRRCQNPLKTVTGMSRYSRRTCIADRLETCWFEMSFVPFPFWRQTGVSHEPFNYNLMLQILLYT